MVAYSLLAEICEFRQADFTTSGNVANGVKINKLILPAVPADKREQAGLKGSN
jgi:hypothetical protein